MSRASEAVGLYVASCRRADKLSQRSVAKRVGCSHVFIGQIERGDRGVPLRMIPSLVDAIPSMVLGTLCEEIYRSIDKYHNSAKYAEFDALFEYWTEEE